MLRSRDWYSEVAFVGCFCWFILLINGADGQVTHPTEVTALRTFKKSLIDPNHNLTNWRKGDPCRSNWTGVLCHNRMLDDAYFHVRELQLLNLNLSGTLSPAIGQLIYMEIFDVMWNNISGSIPKEVGNITALELLLVNGNQLTGSLPDELGNLPVLNRIQIDQNQISGSLPKTLANLNHAKHLHMNNNSISGQIPAELARMPNLLHMLLDNNNLSGYLPPELANMPSLLLLQLDNNHFPGTTIPDSYSNMTHLVKLSLRNCSLQGPIPDLSRVQNLTYIDLSKNHFSGSIPTSQLSINVTTIILSNNNLTGTIPSNFSNLRRLQRLSLENNSLSGSVESNIWHTRHSDLVSRLIVDLRNNMLTNISGSTTLPPRVTVRLQGNQICSTSNLIQFCGPNNETLNTVQKLKKPKTNCPIQSCPPPYEYSPESPIPCFCSAPLLVGWRLKSPGFSDFIPYIGTFDTYLSSDLSLYLYQLKVSNFIWDEGPRLRLYLKFFPVYNNTTSLHEFNRSEVLRIRAKFTDWKIYYSHFFGPYELLNFTLWGPYKDDTPSSSKTGISQGTKTGIVIGTVTGALLLSTIVSLLILRRHKKKHRAISKKRRLSHSSIKIDDVKEFTYEEMALATAKFDDSSKVGEGGYGKVYKGALADGTIVAIKRAQERSLQGETEFLTEIQLLSRLHHRNLVSLVGYCDDQGEQMLIYEFMANGTLREHLSGKTMEPLSFAMRLRIALGSAKGILYLHTEVDPPIFHRDVKATNILLDSKYNAKVSDFGLSRLAPVPDLEGMVPTHVSTAVKGTPGYLDPEYFRTHFLTDKSDVYSLGVVFLELLTGLPPISHGKNLVREVNRSYQSGSIFSIIDDKMGPYPSECVEKFISLALKCCHGERVARPSMAEVVRELEDIWAMMPESYTKSTEFSSDTPSSSKTTTPSYGLSDTSGTELSGVVSTLLPR